MNTENEVWLGTQFNTRAGRFYRKAVGTEVRVHRNREINFEILMKFGGKWNHKIFNFGYAVKVRLLFLFTIKWHHLLDFLNTTL
jgi:hypothetical protein